MATRYTPGKASQMFNDFLGPYLQEYNRKKELRDYKAPLGERNIGILNAVLASANTIKNINDTMEANKIASKQFKPRDADAFDEFNVSDFPVKQRPEAILRKGKRAILGPGVEPIRQMQQGGKVKKMSLKDMSNEQLKKLAVDGNNNAKKALYKRLRRKEVAKSGLKSAISAMAGMKALESLNKQYGDKKNLNVSGFSIPGLMAGSIGALRGLRDSKVLEKYQEIEPKGKMNIKEIKDFQDGGLVDFLIEQNPEYFQVESLSKIKEKPTALNKVMNVKSGVGKAKSGIDDISSIISSAQLLDKSRDGVEKAAAIYNIAEKLEKGGRGAAAILGKKAGKTFLGKLAPGVGTALGIKKISESRDALGKASGFFDAAGSVASLIPGVGTIAGGVLGGIGTGLEMLRGR